AAEAEVTIVLLTFLRFFSEAHSGCGRKAMLPRSNVSLSCSTANCGKQTDLALQSSLKATYKRVCFKRLVEERNCATRKGLFFKLMVRSDHDHRHRRLACRKVLF